MNDRASQGLAAGIATGPRAGRLPKSLRRGRDGLGDDALERLVGVLGDRGIELAELGDLGDIALEGGLDVVRLDLDRLVERLDAGELLDRGRAGLERLLGVVGGL